MPTTLSLANARIALSFELAYWRDGSVADADTYAPRDVEFQSFLSDLQGNLNRVRLEIIGEFEEQVDGWSREARAAKWDGYNRKLQDALAWKFADEGDVTKLKVEIVQRDTTRREGMLRSLVRNQFSQWLRKHGDIPDPQQIVKDFEGLKVEGLVYREVLRQLKVNRWRFTDLKPLEEGATGEVFEVHDRHVGRQVAMKQLRKELPPDQYGSLIQNESRITARLNYPGVPFVLGTGQWDRRPFFVMELLPRDTLLTKIGDFHNSEAPLVRHELSCLRLLRRVISVCEIIQHAHDQKICHHDIKPTNILCGQAPVETYLIDWGFARQYDGQSSFRDLEQGTPDYIAPECVAVGAARIQTTEHRRLSFEAAALADVYSLGATLYHLISGRSPFTSLSEGEIIRALKTLRSSLSANDERSKSDRTLVEEALREPRRNALVAGLRSDHNESNQHKILKLRLLLVPFVKIPTPRTATHSRIDQELIGICRKAMARKPDERYPSAKELAKRLESWIVDAPNPDYATWPMRHPFIWLRRHPRLFGTLKVMLIVALIMLATVGVFAALPMNGKWKSMSEMVREVRGWYLDQ